MRSFNSFAESSFSAVTNALAPPERSRPVLILVFSISPTEISGALSMKSINSLSIVVIVSFCYSLLGNFELIISEY